MIASIRLFHIVAPFLVGNGAADSSIIPPAAPQINKMGLENLMSWLPHLPIVGVLAGTPHKAAVPVPGVWLLPVPA